MCCCNGPTGGGENLGGSSEQARALSVAGSRRRFWMNPGTSWTQANTSPRQQPIPSVLWWLWQAGDSSTLSTAGHVACLHVSPPTPAATQSARTSTRDEQHRPSANNPHLHPTGAPCGPSLLTPS